MPNFKTILENHFSVLTEYGSAGALARKPGTDRASILRLNALSRVTLPEDLITYFQSIDGYDSEKESEYDEMPMDIAAGMAPMDVTSCLLEMRNFAGFNGPDDTYWPLGFVPILHNYGGDNILVNCVEGSPTYGGVYDFTEGVGVNLLAHNLAHFFECATNEITTGLRVFRHDDEDYEYQSIEVKGFDEKAEIYGHTPYFQRKGHMTTQIIDWV